jgi:hypothetical protein
MAFNDMSFNAIVEVIYEARNRYPRTFAAERSYFLHHGELGAWRQAWIWDFEGSGVFKRWSGRVKHGDVIRGAETSMGIRLGGTNNPT